VDRVVTHGSHEGSMNCSMSVATPSPLPFHFRS